MREKQENGLTGIHTDEREEVRKRCAGKRRSYRRKKGVVFLCCVLALSVTLMVRTKSGGKEDALSFQGRADALGLNQTLTCSKEFSEYEKYGLSYDASENHLLYSGEIVGFFHDETAPGVYRHIVYREGSVGLRVIRNDDYRIEGLELTNVPHGDGDTVQESPGQMYEINGK